MGQTITPGSSYTIYYKKPVSKTKGSWSASQSGESIIYNATNGEIDEPGVWQFQGYYLSSGEPVWGSVVEQYVGENLATV